MYRFLILTLLLSTAACSPSDPQHAQQASPQGAKPEASIAAVKTPDWKYGAMAAAANPHAVDAAIEMLEKGGHAVDAAIAAHTVLGLVEPQSSGIGGGAFMLVHQRADKSLVFYDGREVAPAGATVDMFMRDGVVMDFYESWQSGIAVGVPGAVAMYKSAHEQHGKLPWADLFQPAIRLAQTGFAVSPRLAGFLPRMAEYSRLDENPVTAAYFYPDGEPLQVGHILKNPDYAATLTRIAEQGPSAFYQGELAAAMASAAQAAPNGGTLSVEDIAAYDAVRREAICGAFRTEKICTTTPPSSGGAQIMMAGLYEQLQTDANSRADKIAAFVDAQRLAYADRDHFFGDPDAIEIPLQELLHPDYIRHRASQRFAPGAIPTHGDPQGFLNRSASSIQWAADTTEEVPGTTHMSIVDASGNAVALSATVEAPFGSSRMVGGFLLNNQMTDFAREVPADGKPVANAIAPGRRPRSSMSPTMVFDRDGELLMVTGSPGGNSIPAYVSKSIIGILDWKLSAQAAVDFPNLVARGEKVRVEVSVVPGKEIAADLRQRGYTVQEREGENSGLHVIVVRSDSLDGAADVRREGVVKALRFRVKE
jgi:gamma-glutamyltranspeptidase/glutathione hydrolase